MTHWGATSPAGSPAGPVPSLDQRIGGLEKKVIDICGRMGRGELTGRLARGAEETSREITVVVAGETSRGKSALINALLGRADLLPTDSDVSTGVYVVVRHGTPERAEVVLGSRDQTIPGGDGHGERLEIPLSSLPEWVSVSGNPGNARGVRAVDVFLEHRPIADGLTLVDTPGVGGIEASHADITMVALSRADALLFVMDAKAPISGPESAFLTRAAERIDTVIFCLTKIDLFPGWETIAREDREALTGSVPRFGKAPIVPVSSLLRHRAITLEAKGHPLADQLNRQSGFDQLSQTLDERVVRPGNALRRANRIRRTMSVLEHLEKGERARLGTAEGDSRHKTELAAARGRIRDLKLASSTWSVQLQDDVARLRIAVTQTVNREIQGIRQGLPASALRDPEHLAALLPSELQVRVAALLERVNAALADGIIRITDRLQETLGLEGIEVHAPPIDIVLEASPVSAAPIPETSADRAVVLARSVLGAAGPGIMLNALSGGTLLLPGLGLGVALTVLERIKGKRTKDLGTARQEWAAQVAHAVNSVTIAVTPQSELAFLELRRSLEQAVRHSIERTLRELDDREKELQRLLMADEKQRTAAIKNASASIQSFGDLMAIAERLAAENRQAAGLGSRHPPSTRHPPATPTVTPSPTAERP